MTKVIDTNIKQVLDLITAAPAPGLSTAQISAELKFTQRQILKSLNTLKKQLGSHLVATPTGKRHNTFAYKAQPGAVMHPTQPARRKRHVRPEMTVDQQKRAIVRALSKGGQFDDGCTLSATTLATKIDQLPADLQPALDDLVKSGAIGCRWRGGGKVYFKREALFQSGQVAGPRCYDMMRAPPLKAPEWTIARPGAQDARQLPSRGV